MFAPQPVVVPGAEQRRRHLNVVSVLNFTH